MGGWKRVRGTMSYVPDIEVNSSLDTVYLRKDKEWVEEEEYTGWEYNEKQLPFHEWLKQLLDTETGQLIVAENTAETLNLLMLLNEQQKLEQAEASAELVSLIMTMGGM